MSLFSKPAQLAHGPALVGIFLNILLYGVMLAQCFYYFTSFRRKDSMWVKLYVILLLTTDTVNTVLNIYWIYDVLINYFNDLGALEYANWVFASDPALVGITATFVQLFFAYRVWILIRNPWLVTFIVATALCSICGGIGTAIAIKFVPKFEEFQKFSAIVIVWLIAAGVCDVTITVALTYHLRKHKRGFNSSTDDILNKIIRVTVQNGLVTTVWAITDLIVYLASPTGLHLAFNYPLAKLYTNSVMSSLNSRAGWGYGNSTDSNTTSQRDNRAIAAGNRKPGDVFDLRTTGTTRAEVFVDVETHEMVDVEDAVKYPGSSSRSDSDWERNPSKHTI